jgi:hypothetical protein
MKGITTLRNDPGHVGGMGDTKNACKILVGKHEGKSPFGISGHIFEASIEMNGKEVQCVCVDSLSLSLSLFCCSHFEAEGICETLCFTSFS